ncbi:hypothetical protein Taro_029955, partial [Colocasia esculenta]|nr:hypothetical protein [Colocasia esculenta]
RDMSRPERDTQGRRVRVTVVLVDRGHVRHVSSAGQSSKGDRDAQVRESRRFPVLLLVLSRTVVEQGLRHLQQCKFPSLYALGHAPGSEMADRRDWGGGGDDQEDNTQRMIERIWESLTEICTRLDQPAPVQNAVPVVEEAVLAAPVVPPVGVEVPLVVSMVPEFPARPAAAEETTALVERFLRYAPYVVTDNTMMVEYFIRGLRPELQDAVAPLMCRTVEEAAQRAAVLERTLQFRQSQSQVSGSGNFRLPQQSQGVSKGKAPSGASSSGVTLVDSQDIMLEIVHLEDMVMAEEYSSSNKHISRQQIEVEEYLFREEVERDMSRPERDTKGRRVRVTAVLVDRGNVRHVSSAGQLSTGDHDAQVRRDLVAVGLHVAFRTAVGFK